MRKIIQEKIITVIQPEIVEYYCDHCGMQCGTEDNPKQTIYRMGPAWHFCKKSKCYDRYVIEQRAQSERELIPVSELR